MNEFLVSWYVKLRRSMLTWILVILNVFVFLLSFQNIDSSKESFLGHLEDKEFIKAQGNIYAQFLLNSNKSSHFFKKIADDSLNGDMDKLKLLGQLAMRNTDFIKRGLAANYEGDQVEVNYWKMKFQEVMASRDDDISIQYGFSDQSNEISNMVFYQFLHGSSGHLIWNMLFLLLFGAFLEPLLGSAYFLLVYLLSGIFASLSFAYLSGQSTVPLVGASGAISGLMGICLIYYRYQFVRFSYYINPQERTISSVDIPVISFFVFILVMDLVGYMGTLSEIGGGVAHSAHLGGLFMGILIGTIFFWRKAPAKRILC